MESQESNQIENNSSTAVLENTETEIVSSVSQPSVINKKEVFPTCLLYTSPSPRDKRQSRMPSSA